MTQSGLIGLVSFKLTGEKLQMTLMRQPSKRTNTKQHCKKVTLYIYLFVCSDMQKQTHTLKKNYIEHRIGKTDFKKLRLMK